MNGREQPHIDFERLAERLGGHARGVIAAAVIIVLALVALTTSFYTVAPEGQAVVKRFGNVVRVTDPGLHLKWPFWVETATFVPTRRVLKEEFGFRTVQAGQRSTYRESAQDLRESIMLTGDLNVIDVEWVVQYTIDDPDRWLHRVRDPRESIRDVAESVMRQVVGNRLGSEVLTVARASIANEAHASMQEILRTYEMGVHIQSVEMQDVTPPEKVKPAFNEVNEAQQQKEGMINEAEKYRNQVIPRARGEAEQTIAEAEGYAAERVNRAKGEASRFSAIYAEYRKAPSVTRRRLYLETVDTVLPKIGRVYVMEQAGGRGPLPLLDLGGAAAGKGNK